MGQDFLGIQYIRKIYNKIIQSFNTYCISKKAWPILYSELVYKMSEDFLDI